VACSINVKAAVHQAAIAIVLAPFIASATRHVTNLVVTVTRPMLLLDFLSPIKGGVRPRAHALQMRSSSWPIGAFDQEPPNNFFSQWNSHLDNVSDLINKPPLDKPSKSAGIKIAATAKVV
jgi:hypothetical protein